ncbi:DUF4179 domain-containing protein [Paenibacillus brevis]|uniref:DUF4179 domain-containing protein n=1 Tax=Paenibacillus brevis TaxID=2841508 RepID=A0ABS6FTN5_9BACL|nr:DUF4179 domain-containing protein [Paenibacillus brevis]MBU5673286.1 DUF4179 domain-containing protein [Paenibacillus brevis]
MNKAEVFPAEERELQRIFNETRLPQIQLKARVLKELDTTKRVFPARANGFRSRRLLTSISMIVFVIALIGLLSIFPASAEQLRKIPVIGKVFEGNIFDFAGDSGIVIGEESGLTSDVNEEAKDQGVTIKLQNVLYDGARLSIGYEVVSEQAANLMFLENVKVSVNGIFRPDARLSAKPHLIDDKHAAGIITIDLDEPQKEDRFELELLIGGVSGMKAGNPSEVSGEWSFKVNVENRVADSEYILLADGYSASWHGDRLRLTGYLATPATTKLDFFYTGNTDWLGFQLKDDRGMLIEMLDISLTVDKKGMAKGTVRFAPLAPGTTRAEITPFNWLVGNKDAEKVTTKLTHDYPIVLSQGEAGEIVVQNVEFMQDKTLIYYEVKGKSPYMQYASLWLETPDGQLLISDNGKRTRVSDTAYEYILEYPPLDASQPYFLSTMPQTDLELQDELAVSFAIHNK